MAGVSIGLDAGERDRGVAETADGFPRDRTTPSASGLSRPRVLHRLRSTLDHRLSLVVAPAGAGKTTALAHLAEDLERRRAWYQPGAAGTAPATLLDDLRAAVGGAIGRDLAPWPDVAAMARSLRSVEDRSPITLFLDDLHRLMGSTAESTLEDVVRHLPTWITVVAASRRPPTFNLPDLLVRGLAVEVDADVMRWRPWEVERLFRSFYRMPLRPEEAARLTQRTEGWAAGLQLFHLATRSMPASGREVLIDRLHTTPGLVRDYLTRNVLGNLSSDLYDFLVDTCVLGQLDASVCDALRDADDSDRHLADLERQRLFLVPTPDGAGHRYHEVLRAYLEVSLLERDGPVETRARHGRAGRLMEQHGALAEAVHAYARAEAWEDASRVLGADGPTVLAGGGRGLLERLPSALIDADPWLQVSRARSLVGEGRLADAVDAYHAAGRAFGRVPAVETFRGELRAVEAWARNVDEPPQRSTDLLRRALRRDPRHAASEVVASTSATTDLLLGAAAFLLAGAVGDARRLLRRVNGSGSPEVFPLTLARALGCLADLAGGALDEPDDLMWAAETFEQLDIPWLARITRAIGLVANRFDVDEAEATWRMVDAVKDPWGGAILPLVMGIAAVCHDRPRPTWLDVAATACREVGAPTLEAWARAWEALALARLDDDNAGLRAEQARSLARNLLVPGAEAIADLAVAAEGGPGADEAMARARSLADELGLALPVARDHRTRVAVVESTPGTTVRCFGGLRMRIHGREVDLDALKPQSRVVLALLTLHAPAAVHRDHLLEALWPGGDPAETANRLPVLVSTVRRHLEPDVAAGDWSRVVRVGEAHVLRLPPGTWSDVAVFDEALASARRGGHDDPTTIQSWQVAYDAWGGPLLPEFGPAEWVVRRREEYRMAFVDVAEALAAARLRRDDPGGCVDIARAGLREDRCSSRLWRLLVEGERRRGDPAAAARAARDHRDVLAELGVRIEVDPPGFTTALDQRTERNSTAVMARSDPD